MTLSTAMVATTLIYGGFGIDRLYGGAGSDHMYGGDNPDLMDGGSGDDFIFGESSGTDINGSDQLIGGSGNDWIDGGIGIDKLSAGSGDDRVYGGQDTDPFTHGGDGNDYVDGGSGGDILYGDNGDDIVVGGADQDQLFGDAGDDILLPGDPTGALTIGGDEVLGGDGVDQNDIGFDLIDFSDNTMRPGGVTFDLQNQANPATTPNGSSTQVQSFQLDGIVGSVGDDTLIGSDETTAGSGADISIAGNNWLIGGSGNDTMTGSGGNDIIVGGSIRLDALIGKYMDVQYGADDFAVLDSNGNPILTGNASTYDHNNGNDGLNDHDQLLDALYQGASHRVGYADVLDNSGLLGHAETAMFDKHFTEMLRTDMFKNTVLGDGGVDGTADAAVYTGNLAKYQLTALDAQGQVVSNPHLNWSSVFAVKIVDMRSPADLVDGDTGNPLTDPNGNPLVNEGTDLLIGVDKLVFADQTISPEAYFDIAPVVDLNYVPLADSATVAFDDLNNTSSPYGGGTGWKSNWTETNDGTGVGNSSGDIQNWNYRINFGNTGGNNASIDGNETIARKVDLSGLTSAKLTFNYGMNDLESGKGVTVEAWNDTTHSWQQLSSGSFYGAGNGRTANGTYEVVLSGGQLSANSQIRFSAHAGWAGNDQFWVDNVKITASGTTFHDGAPGNDWSTLFTEGGTATAISATTHITDVDDTLVFGATVHIRETVTGDELAVALANVPNAITTEISADKRTVTFAAAGGLLPADFQAAIQSVTFRNTGDNPTDFGTDRTRHIDVTVNDGYRDSAPATTTINVTGIDDPATALANDTIVTNIGYSNGGNGAPTLTVADWMLGANDTDVDGVVISGVSGATGLSGLNHSTGGQSVSFRDTYGAGGSFNYASGSHSATVNVIQDTNGNLDGGTGSNFNRADIILGDGNASTINANGGNDVIDAGGGDDIINAGSGDDIVVWNAGDGSDLVDGGTNGQVGDRFFLNGDSSNETFDIYALTNGQNVDLNNILNVDFAAGTEIVITRTTSGRFGGTSIVAELSNIEEITINTGGGINTVGVHGNFSGTSLYYNTITIDDEDGGDTVDISGLTSDHRIVFNTDANGHVVGNLRPQDVVNGMNSGSTSGSNSGNGSSSSDEEEDEESQGGNSNRAPVSTGSVVLPASGMNMPVMLTAAVLLANTADADGDDLTVSNLQASSGTVEPGSNPGEWMFTPGTDDSSDVTFTYSIGDGTTSVSQTASLDLLPAQSGSGGSSDDAIVSLPGGALVGGNAGDTLVGGDGDDTISGGAGADTLIGGKGDDTILGGDGNDMLMGGKGDDILLGGNGSDSIDGGDGDDTIDGGNGNDLLFGGDGNDTITGGKGNDYIEAGMGSDTAHGGDGDDTFVMTQGDNGNDRYFGDAGSDTLDFSALTADTVVRLDQGFVASSQSGTDTISGIENVVGGIGNDEIHASNAVNILSGGAGNDTFVFGSAAAADGDTIADFSVGDKVDLSGIDFQPMVEGHQSFVLFAGTVFTQAGQVIISHDVRPDGEVTLISGNIDDDTDADFTIEVAGNHTFNSGNGGNLVG